MSVPGTGRLAPSRVGPKKVYSGVPSPETPLARIDGKQHRERERRSKRELAGQSCCTLLKERKSCCTLSEESNSYCTLLEERNSYCTPLEEKIALYDDDDVGLHVLGCRFDMRCTLLKEKFILHDSTRQK